MKKMIAVLAIVLSACGATSKKETASVTRAKPDTVRTVAMYALGNTGQIRIDEVYRVSKDSVQQVVKDSSGSTVSYEKKVVRDTTYWVPIVDTLRDKAGTVQLDSLGKPKMQVNYYPLPPQFIYQDYHKPLRFDIKKQ